MLPRLADFIMSVRREDGNFAGEFSGGQVIVTNWPGNYSTTLTIGPAAQHFALIGYNVSFAPEVIPRAFTIRAQQHGHTLVTGYITNDIIIHGLEMFMVLTHSANAVYVLGNTTNVAQYIDMASRYILVHSEQDYLTIQKALDDLQNKGWSDAGALATQMKQNYKPAVNAYNGPPLVGVRG